MKFKALLIAILLISVFSVSGTALAMTEQEKQTIIAELQAEIQLLIQRITQLQQQTTTTPSQQQATPQDWCYTFNTNLGFSNSGSSDVGQLHTALTKQGISFSPDIGNIYSTGTATAVSIFQERYASDVLRSHGLTKGTGFFGNSTRAKLNQLYGCTNQTNDTEDIDDQTIACTQDSRQCADGSWVSRIPPSCNFAPCPTVQQTCTANNWIFNVSPETCPSSGQQTKIWTKIGTCTGGVSKPAYEVVSCSYQSNTCTSFYYSNWSACSSSGVQTRTVTSSYPSGCTGGNPVTSQACTYTPSCIPDWKCSSWSSCVNGQRTKTCTDYNYCGVTTNQPALIESCSESAPIVDIKANNSEGPLVVDNYSSVVLSWTSQNATSCTASGDWSGPRYTSGSESLTKYQNPTDSVWEKTYTITCIGSAGTATDTVKVNVNPYPKTPTVDIRINNSNSVSPLIQSSNSSSFNAQFTLSWSSTSATYCTGSGSGPSVALSGWSGSKALVGYQDMNFNLSTYSSVDPYYYVDYKITCSGPGGSATDTIRIYYFRRIINPYVSCYSNYNNLGQSVYNCSVKYSLFGSQPLVIYILDANDNKVKPLSAYYAGEASSTGEKTLDFTQYISGLPAGIYTIGFFSYTTTGLDNLILLTKSNWFSISSIPNQY